MERRKVRPSTAAWTSIGVGVVAYDLLCPQGEQLSQRMDEWLEKHPTRSLALGITAMTAMHLLNMLPERIDPIHHLAMIGRRIDDAIGAVDFGDEQD